MDMINTSLTPNAFRIVGCNTARGEQFIYECLSMSSYPEVTNIKNSPVFTRP